MRLSHVSALVFSGTSWFFIGLFLLIKGLNLIVLGARQGESAACIPFFASLAGGREEAALLLIAISLFIGFMKGRYVLRKSAKRIAERILSFPSPIKMTEVYSARYCLLILLMVGLGIGLRWFSVPRDIHGAIDVAVGGALISGALFYFRYAFGLRKPDRSAGGDPSL